jgi:uncharacterized NAD(P)/FAD-binding protein YdhS
MHQGNARLRVTLVDRGPHPGHGIAYSTTCASHLLNTRAGDMSVWPGEPDHFTRWLQAFGGGTGQDFISRQTYGRYLNAMLAHAVDGSSGRLRVAIGEVASVRSTEAKTVIEVAGSDPIVARMAVLATGHRPPASDRGAYRGNPWRPDLLDGLDPFASVLLIGTGLTMIDVVASLMERNHAGSIVALSRRGLLPRAHPAAQHAPERCAPDALFSGALSLRLARFRAMVRTGSRWETVMQTLRPLNKALWQSLDPSQQQRFLRHLRPWWDVHRHRVAPEMSRVVGDAIATGQLSVFAGRVAAMDHRVAHVRVTLVGRGSRKLETRDFDRVIDCRGPRNNPDADTPLLKQLMADELLRADSLQLGIDVDEDDAVITAAGKPSANLFALGQPTRGRHWEITAIPDIRKRAELLAGRLIARLPV